MSDFNVAYQKTLINEGGYVDDPDDPGDETYKGIARAMHGKWSGWAIIDKYKTRSNFPSILEKDTALQDRIAQFYRITFWDPVHGDEIANQSVADSIYDFAVNAGLRTSSALAQLVVGANVDGVIGPHSLEQINAFDPAAFLSAFTVGKIARYVSIVKKNPKSKKYFYGWVVRALNEAG
jgi:lysozyme family protein